MMGNLKRPSKNDHVLCKKHPKHKQSPGVCSLCLNEKLSQVSKTRLRGTRTDSSSSSPSPLSSEYSSSSCSSSYPSPLHHRYRFSTREGNSKGSLSFMFSGKKNNVNGLTKSRSLAFVQRRGGGDDGYSDYKKKTTRGGGFWSKLLHPRRKKTETGLVHSSTMRERTIVVS
ncbi:hypothetical protein HS088_TW12G00962 [Tripterygium wilfordii]|uniref:Uncharacterized protein n=1 Tax=Tripterygium wilfordii TaxID=458696 RepID=A0A7J7D058_TRIWF|nr:uncharacterized protein LOC120010993 [Tripterygium wilfordii]KAF5739752.1 hypothetical protein HS088_TW12G00962 [Tripterygium wilfordii]